MADKTKKADDRCAPPASEHGERCPKEPRGAFKYEDVILAADDGKLYYLPRHEYMKPEHELTRESCAHCYDRAMELLQQGVAMAWIRPRPGNQACYLVNLSSLRRTTPYEPETPVEDVSALADVLGASEDSDQAATSAIAAALAIEQGDKANARWRIDATRAAARSALEQADRAKKRLQDD